jgi:hypothetical protein
MKAGCGARTSADMAYDTPEIRVTIHEIVWLTNPVATRK